MSLLNFIPNKLREPIPVGEDIILKILTNSNEYRELTLDDQFDFIVGFMSRQETLADPERSKIFDGKITDVEFFERKTASGLVLGKKSRIKFMGSLKNGKETLQDIETGWIECNVPWLSDSTVFDIALSNTLANIAMENIGKKVKLRKVLIKAETQHGSVVRQLGNITPYDNSTEKSSNKVSAPKKAEYVVKEPKVSTADYILKKMSEEIEVDELDAKHVNNVIKKSKDEGKTLVEAFVDILEANGMEISPFKKSENDVDNFVNAYIATFTDEDDF